ncbi:hypothetical protein M153_100018673 [Pseudoloma neurophilia]|uniref:Uncharacterized protein n=1 Tax=Pseudoloma neurophilia TaxID=146866 RepID=A0A0R0M8G0_9MICR|nr:hypothetical protein M153_100018673 [Pseudoloma neurophilia]
MLVSLVFSLFRSIDCASSQQSQNTETVEKAHNFESIDKQIEETLDDIKNHLLVKTDSVDVLFDCTCVPKHDEFAEFSIICYPCFLRNKGIDIKIDRYPFDDVKKYLDGFVSCSERILNDNRRLSSFASMCTSYFEFSRLTILFSIYSKRLWYYFDYLTRYHIDIHNFLYFRSRVIDKYLKQKSMEIEGLSQINVHSAPLENISQKMVFIEKNLEAAYKSLEGQFVITELLIEMIEAIRGLIELVIQKYQMVKPGCKFLPNATFLLEKIPENLVKNREIVDLNYLRQSIYDLKQKTHQEMEKTKKELNDMRQKYNL